MGDITIANIIVNFVGKRKDDIDRVVPIGPLYVTASLEEAGYQVDFRDYQLYSCNDPLNSDNVLSFLDECADIVGFSCPGDTLPLVILSAKKLKEKYPYKKVILGGIGPSGVAEEIIKNFDFIDAIAVGEGEKTAVELMRSIEGNWKDIRGLCWRINGKTYMSPLQELIRNLDEVPFPAYNKINLKEYLYLSFITSRGCPFRCTFCDSAPFWQYQQRKRSVDNLIQEIQLLREEYGPNLDRDSEKAKVTYEGVLIIHDETFVIDKDRVFEFCNRLREEKLNIRWMAMGRIDLMDEELMKRMSESGCVEIFYGIESGSESVLKQIKKGIKLDDVKEVISKSLKYFGVTAFFIWGFPFETMEDFHQTLDFISQLSEMGASPIVYSVAPLPLSPLYHQHKEDLIFSEDFFATSHFLLKEHEEIVYLIKRYPTVFPGYFIWKSAKMPEKYEAARKSGVGDSFFP